MATLVHDDLIDGAEFRRGRASAWSAYGPAAARRPATTSSRGRSPSSRRPGDARAVALLADAALCLARGEAMQRRQTHDPETTVEAYLERCSLKTGKLFEAACLLGAAARAPRRVRARARDRLPDRGRHPRLHRRDGRDRQVAGVDLREGTPTLPLILAAREDEVVRRALAGGPLDGALVRVAATGALERPRELALDYARRARAT